jgi:hypothetical protein
MKAYIHIEVQKLMYVDKSHLSKLGVFERNTAGMDMARMYTYVCVHTCICIYTCICMYDLTFFLMNAGIAHASSVLK